MRKGLIDAGYIGEAFTWCNNRRGHERIWQRIDRALFHLDFQGLFPSTSVQHLTRVTSDHSPLIIRLEGDTPKIAAGFIFQRMWVDHPEF